MNEKVKVYGPAGESFTNPTEFLKMLENFKGKYDLKKLFVDEKDVCALYDFKTPTMTTFMSSWYQVENAKIISVRTIFDSKVFQA